jgi:hypothetical protein
MKRLILFLAFSGLIHAAGSVVQAVPCYSSTGTVTCTMTSSVTAGNFLVAMEANIGSGTCQSNNPDRWFSDTLGSVFTQRVFVVNVSGGQSSSCIVTAPITSSGADTITKTFDPPSPNFQSMWLLEIAGIASPVFDTEVSLINIQVSTSFADAVTSINTGNVTTGSANSLLVCVSGDNLANPYDSFAPSGSTTYASVNNLDGFLYKFVGAGTYSCTFGKSAGGLRLSAVALVIAGGSGGGGGSYATILE